MGNGRAPRRCRRRPRRARERHDAGAHDPHGGSTLPAGRAVVGGFLVALAATIVFAAYTGRDHRRRSSESSSPAAPSRPGVHLTRADLTLAPMQVPSSVGFRAVTPLVGATVVGPRRPRRVDPGQRRGRRTAAGRPSASSRCPIDSSRAVSGDLRAGDRVDVAATFGSGADAYTLFVVRVGAGAEPPAGRRRPRQQQRARSSCSRSPRPPTRSPSPTPSASAS